MRSHALVTARRVVLGLFVAAGVALAAPVAAQKITQIHPGKGGSPHVRSVHTVDGATTDGSLRREASTDGSTPVAALTRPQMIGGVTYPYMVLNLVVTAEAFLIKDSQIWKPLQFNRANLQTLYQLFCTDLLNEQAAGEERNPGARHEDRQDGAGLHSAAWRELHAGTIGLPVHQAASEWRWMWWTTTLTTWSVCDFKFLDDCHSARTRLSEFRISR